LDKEPDFSLWFQSLSEVPLNLRNPSISGFFSRSHRKEHFYLIGQSGRGRCGKNGWLKEWKVLSMISSFLAGPAEDVVEKMTGKRSGT